MKREMDIICTQKLGVNHAVHYPNFLAGSKKSHNRLLQPGDLIAMNFNYLGEGVAGLK